MISEKRGYLMGMATILILIFHSSFIPDNLVVFKLIKNTCDVGVDLFITLSGFGLFYSLQKTPKLLAWYRKRLIRVYPEFFVVTAVWCFIIDFITNDYGILRYIRDLTTISFWVDRYLGVWFVSAILVFYLMAPLLFRILGKSPKWFVIITVWSVLLASLLWFLADGMFVIVLCRLPAFMLGMLLAEIEKDGNKTIISVKKLIPVLFGWLGILFICMFFIYERPIIPFYIKYYLYFPLTYLLLCLPIPKFQWLNILGTVSYECYLLFEKVLYSTTVVYERVIAPTSATALVFINISALSLTIIGAIILKWIYQKISQQMLKTRQKLLV